MAQTNLAIARPPRITVIDARTPEKVKLRVAAYARVSSDSDDQINSYLSQVNYYTSYISSNEDWELVDIYADEGISGLEARKRDDFNRMLADCRAGKIDRLLVKSTSRFARNTKEYIQYMRELLRLGVSIYFEKENIDTGKMTSEQVAQIYGAFAQMESTNHSSNMRLSMRLRMENGEFLPPSAPYGYRLDTEEREMKIIPEEADVVRYIFSAYLSGQGKDDIAKELNALGVERGKDRERWHPFTVDYILTNISYTGDELWQKSFATDTIPFRQVPNRGQKPKYFVEDCHEPIISKEDFERVQVLMATRRAQFQSGGRTGGSVFKKRIVCGSCGRVCRRKAIRGKTYWVCHQRDVDKAGCPVPQVPETEIAEAVLRAYHKLKENQDLLASLLEQLQALRERELRSNRKISDIDNEIAHLSEQNLVLARLKSKGYVDSALFLSQQDEMARKLRDLRRLRHRIMESAEEDGQILSTEGMLDYLEGGPDWMEEVNGELFDYLVDHLALSSAKELKITLLNGVELTEPMELTERMERVVR